MCCQAVQTTAKFVNDNHYINRPSQIFSRVEKHYTFLQEILASLDIDSLMTTDTTSHFIPYKCMLRYYDCHVVEQSLIKSSPLSRSRGYIICLQFSHLLVSTQSATGNYKYYPE